ncbi:MAG: site-2 protease family protein, partial [Clostridiales bacterium]|nr:site-2 protease family protein [Clostridiales bacterium]
MHRSHPLKIYCPPIRQHVNLCAIWWEFEVIVIVQVLLVIIAVLLFGFIIFIHEFGHFMTAKLSGIRVNEFAIGMGPTLFRFQKGETTYALRLLPIGGFCAMEGEDEDSDDEG